jgi:6-phosphogluconolactonase
MSDTAATQSTNYGRLLVVDDPADLARHAANYILACTKETEHPVRIALSGGSTPRQTYNELVGPLFIERIPWQRVHWFWGDERFVPPDDAASNFRMVREAMLSRAPIPRQNIHPIPTLNLSPTDAVAEYERTLQVAYGQATLETGRALFDVCLLGLGDDGHTASLLPGEAALDERERWVAAAAHGRPEIRITLTYPAINSSRHVVFLVSGQSKRSILREVLSGRSNVPAARLASAGELLFIADRTAVGQ